MAEPMDDAIERVKSAYDAFNRGDFDEAATFLHPDITWNRVAQVETPLRGRDAARANMEPDVFASQRGEIFDAEVAGDCVIVRAAFHGTGAGSGIEMTDEAFHLWRMKDGMAIEFRYFATREEALEAAVG